MLVNAWRILLIFCVTSLYADWVRAQETQTITLNDAVRIALDQNYQLRTASNSVRQQENNLRGARYFLLPSVSVGTNAGRSYGLSFDQTVGELTNYSVGRVGFNSNANLTVFSGFRDWAALRQAQLGVTRTGWNMSASASRWFFRS